MTPLDHNAYSRCDPLRRDSVLPMDPVPDVHVLPDATPYLPTRISTGGSSADPSPPPTSVAIMHLMVVRSGWGLGVGKPVVVPCPLVCIPARIHRRGAAIDVGGKIVAGIVGDVGSRSDGSGGDVNVDAQGRVCGRLQRSCGNSDGCQVSGQQRAR